MLDWALEQTESPLDIRVSAHDVNNGDVTKDDYKIPKFETLNSGKDVAVLALGGFLALGRTLQERLLSEGNINATLINHNLLLKLIKLP